MNYCKSNIIIIFIQRNHLMYFANVNILFKAASYRRDWDLLTRGKLACSIIYLWQKKRKNKKGKGKVIAKYLFYNINIFPKFYFNKQVSQVSHNK